MLLARDKDRVIGLYRGRVGCVCVCVWGGGGGLLSSRVNH